MGEASGSSVVRRRRRILLRAICSGLIVGWAAQFLGMPFGLALLAVLILYRAEHTTDRTWGRQKTLSEAALLEAREVRALLTLQDCSSEVPLPWSGWALSPTGLQAVVRTILIEGRSGVLECGSGVSTVHLARVMRGRGHGRVTALEHDRRWAEVVQTILHREGLQDWATVLVCPLVKWSGCGQTMPWYDISEATIPPFDLLLVDGPPGSTAPLARFPALPALWHSVGEDCVVFLDDASRGDEKTICELWASNFPLSCVIRETKGGLAEFRRKMAD